MPRRLNLKETRAEMHQSALDALGDIKKEMLLRVFGAGLPAPGVGGGAGAAEQYVESDQDSLLEARAEVAELTRAMAKIQAWFKIRSQAFQSACQGESDRSRKQVRGGRCGMLGSRALATIHLQPSLANRGPL